eukprot:PhF_6_TR26061/c8_g1_i1/m.36740
MPDLLHIVPGSHDTVLDGVADQQDTTLGLGVVTNVVVLLGGSQHGLLLLRAANNRREHSAWGIITGESGLHHTGSVVAHDGLLVITVHFVSCCGCCNKVQK